MKRSSLKNSTFRRVGPIVAIIAVSHGPLLAHDMWIEPSTFLPAPGAVVGLRLRVGENLVGDPVPRNRLFIDQFVVVDEGGRQPVLGREGADPAGVVRVATPGLLIVGYRSKPRAVELAAEKFNEYLQEEGLEAVAALRARRNETGLKGREVFSRCAKSLVLAGQPSEAQGDRMLGLTLELVAERNPYAAASGEEIPFLLTYEKRALPGALVVAINRFNPAEKLTARTDDAGRVRFHFKRPGMWLVKAVHMVPAPAGVDADWASYWASVTFSLKS